MLRRLDNKKAVINLRRTIISLGLAFIFLLIWPASALAATDPNLGTAGNYAVLAGTTITNTGPSWISGRMAVQPGSAVTGFPGAGGATSGPIDAANPAACAALGDLGPASSVPATCNPTGGGAYTRAAGATPCTTVGANLGGSTLGPGIYCGGTLGITGGQTLTLSGGGVYIFQSAATLITGNAAVVMLTGGAQPCDIFWQVTSSVTLAPSTSFVGNIMALTSIAMQTGATLWGRAGARNGAVTLDTNRIIQPSGCTTGLTASYPPPPAVAAPPGNTLPASLGTIVTAPPSPTPTATPAATPAVLPGATGIPPDMRGGFPWLLLMAMGAGAGAAALYVNNRRRRRRTG